MSQRAQPKVETTTLNVRVSFEELEALKRKALAEDRTVSAEVRRALRQYLEGKA